MKSHCSGVFSLSEANNRTDEEGSLSRVGQSEDALCGLVGANTRDTDSPPL